MIEHQFWKCQIKKKYFKPIEVVGRGSETQLQLGENLKYLIMQEKG